MLKKMRRYDETPTKLRQSKSTKDTLTAAASKVLQTVFGFGFLLRQVHVPEVRFAVDSGISGFLHGRDALALPAGLGAECA